MTDVIQGHRFLSAFAKQSAEGTVATTAEYGVPAASGTVMPNEDRQDFEAIDSNPYRTGQYKSRADVVGTVDYYGFPDSVGRLITAHLGSDTKTGAGDPWTHTIVQNYAPQWLTFWTQRPLPAGASQWDRHLDCMVKEVTVQFNAGQPIRIHTEIIGKKAKGNVSAPTVTTTNVLDSTGAAYAWSGATLKYDIDATPGVTPHTDLETFDLRMAYAGAEMVLTENLNPDWRDIGLWELSLSATFLVSDWQAYLATNFGSKTASDAFQSATIISGGLDFTLNVFAGGATRTLQFVVNAINFALENPDPDVSGKGLRATLTAKLQKPASGAPVTVVLLNGVNAAY